MHAAKRLLLALELAFVLSLPVGQHGLNVDNVVHSHLPQHVERQPAWWAHRCSNAQSESREHLPAKKVRGKA